MAMPVESEFLFSPAEYNKAFLIKFKIEHMLCYIDLIYKYYNLELQIIHQMQTQLNKFELIYQQY